MLKRFRARLFTRRLRIGGDAGGSLVEMAFVMPILLFTVFGIAEFGFTMNSALELTNGVTLGAQYMATLRGISTVTDPCASTAAVINARSPLPAAAGIKYTFQIYTSATASVTYPTGGVPTASPTCTAGAAELTQNQKIVVTANSPCVVLTYGDANILPNCELPAQITVISQ